jgi:hypothetical protein
VSLSFHPLPVAQNGAVKILKFGTKIFGKTDVEAILKRLDRLTEDELRITAAQTFEIVHDLAGSMKAILGASDDTGKPILICWSLARLFFNVRSLDGGLKTWSDGVQNGLRMFLWRESFRPYCISLGSIVVALQKMASEMNALKR